MSDFQIRAADAETGETDCAAAQDRRVEVESISNGWKLGMGVWKQGGELWRKNGAGGGEECARGGR